MKLQAVIVIAAATLLLSACGGGSYEAPPLPEPARAVPASAVASPRAYTEFAASLEKTETAQPLSVDLVVMPPTTETGAPLAL